MILEIVSQHEQVASRSFKQLPAITLKWVSGTNLSQWLLQWYQTSAQSLLNKLQLP